MEQAHQHDWGGLTWSPWLPLDASVADFRRAVTTEPGLYRVRAVGQPGLVYIGQTGRNLRERTRGLSRNVYRAVDNPPWNDPHTAAPGLWAWRIENGLVYEVAVAPCHLEKAERLCKEDELLYLHRVQVDQSTLCNHGRFHPRWRRPSNRKQAVSMRRLDDGLNPAGGPSLKPAPPHGSPTDADWLGLAWSAPLPLSSGDFPSGPGVYRLLLDGDVVYLGESKSLKARMRAHAKRFVGASASWVFMASALPHHLKERECDLIGAHYRQLGCPKAQWAPNQ